MGRRMRIGQFKKYKKKKKVGIEKCGLFIDSVLPYLAATPDGTIKGENGIVEVKCPFTCETITPQEFIKNKMNNCLLIDVNGEIKVNKRHNHYYQVQVQLHITSRDFCLFGIWSPLGLITHVIEKDETFWKREMEPHLVKFYNECVLPKLIDPRFIRSMEIRDPVHILYAINT